MIVVCRFCPNTLERPPHSHRFTCDECQRRRRGERRMRWLRNKPLAERRAYYREQQRKEKARYLRRLMAS